MKSPEFLTAQLLIDQGHTYAPPLVPNAPKTRFTQFINSFPDSPKNAVAVTSIGQGGQDGRLMDGTPINHPGLQVRVRAHNSDDAHGKIISIWDYVCSVHRARVTILTETYRIDNLSVSGEPYFIGLGPDDQLPSYVFDLKITYKLIGA